MTSLSSIAFTAILLIAFSSIVRKFFRRSGLEKIRGPPQESFMTGHLLKLFDSMGFPFHEHIVSAYGQVVKVKGLMNEDQLYATDPRALYQILATDCDVFEAPTQSLALSLTLFGQGLSGVSGKQHKKQRKILNPVFTPGHIKELTPFFYQVAHQLQDAILSEIEGSAGVVDMLNWCTRVGLELVGRGALGYSFGRLDEKNNTYANASKTLIPNVSNFRVAIPSLPLLRRFGPSSLQRFIVDRLPFSNVQALKENVDVLESTAKQIYDGKMRLMEKGLESVADDEVTRGKDILSLLFKANATASEKDRLTKDEVMGMMSLVVFAALDTTSGALSHMLQVLAENQDMQDRLRQEIIEATSSQDDIPYDVLTSLPYLDAVIKAVLRLYPPLIMMDRIATRDTQLPLLQPINLTDGTELTTLPIKKGTTVWMGIATNNRNELVWGKDANDFNPERWLRDSPLSVANVKMPGVFSSIMTFLGGARACIGYRFSLLETKVVLACLLQKFRFEPSDDRVFWKLAHITSPHVEGSDTPQLPLKVFPLARE